MATTLFDTENVNVGSTPSQHRSRPGHKGDWYSGNGYDLTVRPGTKVYSISDGVVISMNSNNKRTGNIYGDRVTVKSEDDEIYYTHIDSKVRRGEQVKKGDLIGTVVEWEDAPTSSHLHIASRYKDVRNYVDFKTWVIGGAVATGSSKEDGNSTNDTTQQNNNPSPTQGPISDFYRLLANKTAIPMALAALPGLSKEEHLQEQIQRIKNLM
jgi:hypothetical protein